MHPGREAPALAPFGRRSGLSRGAHRCPALPGGGPAGDRTKWHRPQLLLLGSLVLQSSTQPGRSPAGTKPAPGLSSLHGEGATLATRDVVPPRNSACGSLFACSLKNDECFLVNECPSSVVWPGRSQVWSPEEPWGFGPCGTDPSGGSGARRCPVYQRLALGACLT